MKRKVLAGSALALFAAVPAIVAPQLTSVAHAQTAVAEYPDVPRGHWAYEAINKLSQAGIIEGLPNGNYYGNKPMTRYEFAVAIARLLERISTGVGPAGPQGETGPVGPAGAAGAQGPAGTVGTNPTGMTRDEVNDLINSLKREFADELARMGVRVDAVENRLTMLEGRVAVPPRMTITPSLLHRTGTATYISQVPINGRPGNQVVPGRNVVNGNSFTNLGDPNPSAQPYVNFRHQAERLANEKYSYTDFELRLTDRVTDRLNVVGALRSLGGTNEDAWAGDSNSNLYVREAYAVADLSDRSFIGIKGLNVILGRQPTKIAQGLLYDNDLAPTDQLRADFGLGPLQLSAFIGSNNNQQATGFGGNPYQTTGAVPFLGAQTTVAAANQFGRPVGFDPFALTSGAITGFAAPSNNPYVDDNEAAARVGFNLFRLAGQPVSVGVTHLFDGVQNQQGDSIDLTIPLFNRTIGVEYVRQTNYSDRNAPSRPNAYNITVPLLRTRVLDANFAYGKAENSFEYFTASSANPFARTYAEALFDRPMALGAPMINGRAFGAGGAVADGQPVNAAAKKVFDFTGTLRVIKRLPLDFRYYKAYGTQLGAGGQDNALDLGAVYTIGSTFNVSPGLDLEVKYGHYGVYGPVDSIQYVRVGANVGF